MGRQSKGNLVEREGPWLRDSLPTAAFVSGLAAVSGQLSLSLPWAGSV